MKNIFWLFTLILFSWSAKAQVRFTEEVLSNAKKYGKQVEQSFKIQEIPIFNPKQQDSTTFFLQNGLRSSKYVNAEAWEKIRADVEVKSISIVFSKYPIRKGTYSMVHKLLFNRLKNLFAIDPYLNDQRFDWQIVLQTDCKNDAQVDSLFHGVMIQYELPQETIAIGMEKELSDSTLIEKKPAESLQEFTDFPQEVVAELQGKSEKEQAQILISYFNTTLRDSTQPELTPSYLEEQETLLEKFIHAYSNQKDSTIFEVLNRNADWDDVLVVTDWTGSMYQYGAQALLWHVQNIEQSGFKYFTLFNDGDGKRTDQKVTGRTDGVYHSDVDHIDRLLKLYQLVMLKGSGGDTPENDIEAILKATKKFPQHKTVVLIADNDACVRDIDLLPQLKVPVKVVLCGYKPKRGINPQYIKIAKETGGSIHTIEHDIENIQTEQNGKGKVKKIVGFDLNLASDACDYVIAYHPPSYYKNRVYRDLDSATNARHQIVNLDLSGKALEKAPSSIRKMKGLESLNLSKNGISKVTRPIYNSYVKYLNLSHNQISEIPLKMGRLFNLEQLDLSHNQLDSIGTIGYRRLRTLKNLNLSNNNLAVLPTTIDLRNLEHLYLDRNQLDTLSPDVLVARRLKSLSLARNQLSALPKRISRLKKLEYLDLSDNNFTTLPPGLANLRKLKTLILVGNNLPESSIAWLREMLPNTNLEYQ